MRIAVLAVFLFLIAADCFGQDDLFGVDSSRKTHSGLLINGNLTGDLPAGDMAKRFGKDFRVGFSLTYKTRSNWLFGASCDFLAGNKIKEDSFMINIKDKYSGPFNGKIVELINSSGYRVGVPVYERGYLIGVQAGHIFNRNRSHPDNGFTLLTTAGFIQHKITIFNRDKDVQQIRGNYLKGYDRLTNGFFLEQFAGYTYFAPNGLLNFNFGLDVMVGFTQGRRDYLYDVMRPDDKKRTDILVGARAGWMIPSFKRRSEDISFE